MENNELKDKSEENLVRYWLSNNVTLEMADERWFDESKSEHLFQNLKALKVGNRADAWV